MLGGSCRLKVGGPPGGVQLAREQLSELELPHVYKAAARGSPKRQQLLDKRGAFQVFVAPSPPPPRGARVRAIAVLFVSYDWKPLLSLLP